MVVRVFGFETEPLEDVIDELGGRFFENDFCDRHTGQMETCTHSEVDCSLRSLWKALQVAVDEVLRKTTLQDLMRDDKQMTVLVTQLAGGGFSLPVKPA